MQHWNPRFSDGGPGSVLRKMRHVAELGGLPPEIIDTLMREGMTEAGAGTLGAWIDDSVSRESPPCLPLALVGPGADWFAALMFWTLRLVGVDAQNIPWSYVREGGTGYVPDELPELGVLVGPPAGPVNAGCFGAICTRVSLLLVGQQAAPISGIETHAFRLVPDRVEKIENFCSVLT